MHPSNDGQLAILPDERRKTALRRKLLAWFATAARDLPWRTSRDPYRVWVSEIMLQQTQVATVIGYFHRFIDRFSTLAALAAADESEVLRLWEGLGYYRRARQMHLAASKIVAEHDGQFPRDLETVRSLPGIGRYTAGAILSIAFDDPHPILEANTLRVYSRLLGYRGDPRGTEGQKLLWQFAAEILPQENVGALNQSLMELGATICTPREPDCSVCPVASLCRARELALVDSIPPPAARPVIEERQEVAVVIERPAQSTTKTHSAPAVLLHKRSGDGRWGGLWDFPRFDMTDVSRKTRTRRLVESVEKLAGTRIEFGQQFATLKHGVTRFRITLDCHRAHWLEDRSQPDGEIRWVPLDELDDYPLSVTGRKIAKMLQAAASKAKRMKLPAAKKSRAVRTRSPQRQS